MVTTATLPSLPPSLTHWPGYLMTFIAEHASERFERDLGPAGIRSKHAALLVVIDAEGPMSQRALGRRLRIDKSPMVGLVDDLEREGLAERRRGARDRRVQAIHLTAKGRRVLERVTRLADEGNERTFGALDEDERMLLHDLLLRVAEATPPTADRLLLDVGRQRADDVLQPCALAVVVRQAPQAAHRPAPQQLARTHGHQRADDRVAPVVERDERAGHVAAHPQLSDHLGAGDRVRVGGVAVERDLGERGDGERGPAALHAPRRARRGPDRPLAPALDDAMHVARELGAQQHVQAVAGAQDGRAARRDGLVAADDDVDHRLARQPEVAHACADHRVVAGRPGTRGSRRPGG